MEDYLKYETNAEGERVPRTNAITAINADREDFAEDCRWLSVKFNTCQEYDSLKYKHYVQGFPPEDNDKMTRAQCHALGVEAARALWPDFPVLVVTHYDQKVDGTDLCHWHNHFIVYNCAVTDGHKLNTSRNELWRQKRYIAAQADYHGLTRKGLILENGRIRESTREVKTTGQWKMQKRAATTKDGATVIVAQKTELRIAIISACNKTDTYEDFCRYLKEHYRIDTKESRGSIGFLHPERRGTARAWIRGKTLGEEYTKEAILHELRSHDRRRSVNFETEAERNAYYAEFTQRILGIHNTATQTDDQSPHRDINGRFDDRSSPKIASSEGWRYEASDNAATAEHRHPGADGDLDGLGGEDRDGGLTHGSLGYRSGATDERSAGERAGDSAKSTRPRGFKS